MVAPLHNLNPTTAASAEALCLERRIVSLTREVSCLLRERDCLLSGYRARRAVAILGDTSLPAEQRIARALAVAGMRS